MTEESLLEEFSDKWGDSRETVGVVRNSWVNNHLCQYTSMLSILVCKPVKSPYSPYIHYTRNTLWNTSTTCTIHRDGVIHSLFKDYYTTHRLHCRERVSLGFANKSRPSTLVTKQDHSDEVVSFQISWYIQTTLPDFSDKINCMERKAK